MLRREDATRDQALIVRLHDLGLTVKAIADIAGVHSSHVSIRLRSAGRAAPKPAKFAVVVVDELGRRVCPDCRQPLVKKHPHGPGRYPRRCPDCTNGGTTT